MVKLTWVGWPLTVSITGLRPQGQHHALQNTAQHINSWDLHTPASPLLSESSISIPSEQHILSEDWTMPTFGNETYLPFTKCLAFPSCLSSCRTILSKEIFLPHLAVAVQSLSCVWLFVTPWTAAQQASLSSTISQSLFKHMSIESVMPSNYLTLCRPLLLLPSVFPSIRVFSNESAFRIRWQKRWNLSFTISPSNEYSWMISFRIDWFDLLSIQGTLKSLLQHHSSKASVLWC